MGIRLKLSLSLGLLIVLTVGLTGFLALRTEEAFLRRDMETKGRQILRALAIPCAVPLSNHDLSALDNYIAGFSDSEGEALDFLWIAVLDTSGQVLSHTDPRRFREVLEDPFTQRALSSPDAVSEWDEEERLLRLAVPVTIRTLRFGTLRAEMSLARLDARVMKLRLYGIGFISFGAVLAAVMLVFLMSRLVVKPVRLLAKTAERLGAGDLSARVPQSTAKDELATLGEVFNQMASSLQAQTENLERLVEERTRELKAANEQLARLATIDELTGLFNHRYFQETLKFEALRSERRTGPLSLLMIDVDYFKQFNDTHGHPAGDKLLKAVAQKFRENLRTIDIVARYGGEEFAVILLDTSKEDAAIVGEKLRAAIADEPFPGRETQPDKRISVSIGLATMPEDASSPAELISQADAALYRAKRGGRNRVCLAGREG